LKNNQKGGTLFKETKMNNILKYSLAMLLILGASLLIGNPMPSWFEAEPIPPGLSGKKPKAGSCITALNDKLYFLKASNTQDFQVYTPDDMEGTWTSDTMPLGNRENGDGKKPKKGAAITAYQPSYAVYVLRGNNTVGFWKYQVDTVGGRVIGWTKLKNIPIGAKKPKEGSGMASFRHDGDGFIFTMKGSKTDEFYTYSIESDTWHKINSPPTGASTKAGYKQGSCLTYDGGEFMYVLKGIYGDLFKYNIVADTWHELRRYDSKKFISRDGVRKKIRDGASIVFYQNNIYLLKGSNTLEFWQYRIATDTWVQLGPWGWSIPPGSSGKKVKGGGCMTLSDSDSDGYVVKGNNTDEFYFENALFGTLASAQPITNETQADKSLLQDFNLKIAPNPANKVMAVKYNLPAINSVNIKLYNITGALVKSYANSTPAKEGVWNIDVKSLPAGVYLLRFSTLDTKVTRKLVIEK
jgi:Secretion system C-terminal sorting domain